MKTHEWLEYRWRRMRLGRTYLRMAGLVVVAYILAAQMGLLLRIFSTTEATAIWPASGLGLVALYWLGLRSWPAVFIGVLLASNLFEQPLIVSVSIAVGNTLEALTGAYVLRRWVHLPDMFRRVQSVVVVAVAGLLSTPIAATIGSISLVQYGVITWKSFGLNWIVWFISDLMGYLLFAPLLLVYLNRQSFAILRGRFIEGGLLLACLYGASVIIFTDPGTNSLLYLLFPFFIWAGIRFTQLGAVTCTFLVMATAVWATLSGLGPFVHYFPAEQAFIQLQLFILVILATSLLLAISINARLVAEAALIQQTHELERLDAELKEANRRALNILSGVLYDGSKRRSLHGPEDGD